MQRRNFIKNSILTSTGIILLPSLIKANNSEEQALSMLEKNFINPPANTRPWCFYMWMNGNITKEGITADLEAMKRMGIGGVINFNSAVGIPRGPVDYASEGWMDATTHAIKESNRLGIEFALHNSPGYSGCGGPWVTPEMSMQELVWMETLITGDTAINIQLQQPFAKLNYYQDAFIIAYPSVEKYLMKDKLSAVLLNGKTIDKNVITDKNPDTKIRLELNNSTANLLLEFIEPFEARAIAIYRKPEIPNDLFDGPRDQPPVFKLEASDDNINFNFIGNVLCPELREMDTPATLSFNTVKSKYFRLTVTSPTWLGELELFNSPRLGGWSGKTSNTHGSSNGETPSIFNELIIDPKQVINLSDKMDKTGKLQWNAHAGNWTILRIGHTTTGEENSAHPDAGKGLEIDKFNKNALQFHFDHFLDKLIDKVKPFVGKGFKGITVDSWEAGKQNWTINFPADFKQQMNYGIMQWMPAMTGRIVGSVDETEKFLWDTRRVQADLLTENFYGHYAKLCHQRGLDFYAEPYGDGNFDSLQIGKELDITMSEFWTRYIYGSDNYSHQAVSAAHIYGKKIVAAESFTAMPATAKWTDYPYSLKAEGDYYFALGVNRLVFHTFVHQPYFTGKPGMTMGPFGMHVDRNNTWTKQAYGWTKYIQRSQYLLQQGLTVTDICYFKGDNPESGVPDLSKILPNGYAADVFGPDALLARFSIKNNIIQLPDGMQYRVCIMAPLTSIVLSSINKIKQLVNDGMILLVTNKPSKASGLSEKDEAVIAVINELYGDLNGTTITERNYGKGKIIWGKTLQQVLNELKIERDFDYTSAKPGSAIHYIHKKIDDTEFYFISNHKRRKENIVCSLRSNGKQPVIWNGENGSFNDVVLYETINGRTIIPLELAPAASVFIVLKSNLIKDNYYSILKDGKEIIAAKELPAFNADLFVNITNNFTVTLWAKPDTFANDGKSMLFHPPEGELVYGKGHAAFGLSAGQNGICVFERLKGNASIVLRSNQALEGWTHIVVMYKEGTPSLYVDGKLVATGKSSGNIIHPGMGTAASPEQFASYFEGNYTEPQLFKQVLNADEINKQFLIGLPLLQLSNIVELNSNQDKFKATFYEDGNYAIKSKNDTKSIGIINGCKSTIITGAWQLQLNNKTINLSQLISLEKHPDDDVKYFSGTMIYFKTINISEEQLSPNKKLVLDLGRVEVVAEIKLNGKKLDILWKEPFRIDISKQAIAGNNQLEISVTNLWPNRLIGDEQLPEENKYSIHHFIEKLPDWYVKNQPKPGLRKAFSVWKTHDKNSPLLASGLLGPVQLITAIEKIII